MLSAGKLACLLIACCCAAGCGYRFTGGEGSSSLIRGKTIAVPLFANMTHRPNLETTLTGTLRDEIAWRSGGRGAAAETADLIFTGKVVSYTTTPVSYTGEDRIREYRAAMTVEAALRDRVSGEVVWKGTRTMLQEYPLVDFPIANRSLGDRTTPENRIALQQNSEEAAVREVCRRLARDLYEKISEGF